MRERTEETFPDDVEAWTEWLLPDLAVYELVIVAILNVHRKIGPRLDAVAFKTLRSKSYQEFDDDPGALKRLHRK